MPSPVASTASARGILSRFRRNRSASAAVEFALVAPVFFALLFAIIETAIMFFAGQLLESVTQSSARMILTGQAQNASYTQAQFQTYVCSQIPAILNCNNVYVDVVNYSSFSSVISSGCQIDASGNFINNMQYNPGGPSDIVVVSLCYPWQLYVTGLGYNISNMTGNKRLLMAAAAFRNEPY
jgi:Flp pilus assembly protein TadG